MGDFGDLDTTDEQIANQGYTNCRLISVEVDTRFNSVSNTDSAVLVKTYETLTNLFVQITDDTVTFTDNGLKQITRVYRAISGTTSSNVVGVTALGTGETLASSRIEDNDAFAELTETYIESGILSVQQDFNNGLKRVSVQAFNLDSAAVSAALSEVTVDHKLIATNESDYEGIKTTTFEYQIDESFVVDYELNGLKRISLIELSATDFTTKFIGNFSTTNPTTGLYLATESIDNGGVIKVRQSTWIAAGTLSVSTRNLNEGVKQTTYQYLVNEGSPTGTIIGRRTDNFQGLKTITLDVLTSSDGTDLTGDAGSPKLNYQYQQIVPFTFPGVVDLVIEQNHVFPSVRSPVEARVLADVYIYYQSSQNISVSDFTLHDAVNIWNPSDWCQKISTIDSFVSDSGSIQPAYYNAQGIRGCRTRESIEFSGISGVTLDAYTGQIEQTVFNLEETTTQVNGRSTYQQVINYNYDVTSRVIIYAQGGYIFVRPIIATGELTITCQWTGSEWEIIYSDVVEDKRSTDSNNSDLVYTYSARTGEWSELYTNASSTTTGTLVTSTSGGPTPADSSWPSGISVKPPSRKETVGALSTPADADRAIQWAGYWIEGRQVDNGASGKISIEGGPTNPFGKRYVLDVNIKKAFEDIDGNITWMKQVVVADCTPVSA